MIMWPLSDGATDCLWDCVALVAAGVGSSVIAEDDASIAAGATAPGLPLFRCHF